MNEEQQLATIKKPGEVEKISEEEFERRALEIARCKRDIVYFAEKYYRVISLDKGLHIIKLYDIQKEFLRFLVNNNKVICVSGRQQGKSTIYCIYSLWLATFFPEKKIMILANKAATALELLSRIETGYQYLPHWIKSACLVFNKGEITFSNMSSIRAFASSSDAARGFSANCIASNSFITVRNADAPCLEKTMCIKEFADIFLDNAVDVDEHDYDEYTVQSNECQTKSKCIRKKFQKSVAVNGRWQVKCDTGWNDVERVNIGHNALICRLSFKSGKTLKCTARHVLIDERNEEVYAFQSVGCIIKTEDGLDEVMSYEMLSKKEDVFDLSLNGSHLYYANGILSHNCVILDEFAFLQKSVADKLFTSMYPVVSSSKNGKFILVSTPNGTDNLYYDIWCQANSKEVGANLDGWKPFEMYWWQVPGHDEEWKKRQIAAIGAQRFAQEFDNQFLAKSENKKLVPDYVIEQLRIKLSEYKAHGIEPKMQKIVSQSQDELYEFEMWHEFQAKRTYLATADIAEGIGGDSSVLYVWDVTDMKNIIMCARFSSNVTSLVQFAYVASKILPLYGNPWLAAERNGVSAGMLDSLKITFGYQRIAIENKKREAGIYSHVQVKSRACLWARDMLTMPDCFGFTIYDKALVDEMNYFIKKDTKGVQNIYHAMPGPNSHDDHMMAFIWMAYMLHNDRVQDYFLLIDTSTTQIGTVYPWHLKPLEAYSEADIAALTNDPLYKEFLEFKVEAMKRGNAMMEAMKKEDSNDVFQYEKPDMYFGDDDGGSWNSTPVNWNMSRDFQQGLNSSPSLNSRSYSAPPCFVI